MYFCGRICFSYISYVLSNTCPFIDPRNNVNISVIWGPHNDEMESVLRDLSPLCEGSEAAPQNLQTYDRAGWRWLGSTLSSDDGGTVTKHQFRDCFHLGLHFKLWFSMSQCKRFPPRRDAVIHLRDCTDKTVAVRNNCYRSYPRI